MLSDGAICPNTTIHFHQAQSATQFLLCVTLKRCVRRSIAAVDRGATAFKTD